ncbi:tRNA-binding protein [Candidatus Nanohaloarchaea archaeon]|nr:tRNA-binding protein [Candidatus Nanohaloarchaea archaeon]
MTGSLFDTDFKVGTVEKAEDFSEAEKPEMAKLWIDLGDEKVQSAAQTGYNYGPEDLEGRQVICATNLGNVRIAGFKSEVLTVGVPDSDGNPVLVGPDSKVPEGGNLY